MGSIGSICHNGYNILKSMWRFPKNDEYLLEIPVIRTIVCWGLCWGPPTLGNYHVGRPLSMEPPVSVQRNLQKVCLYELHGQ